MVLWYINRAQSWLRILKWLQKRFDNFHKKNPTGIFQWSRKQMYQILFRLLWKHFKVKKTEIYEFLLINFCNSLPFPHYALGKLDWDYRSGSYISHSMFTTFSFMLSTWFFRLFDLKQILFNSYTTHNLFNWRFEKWKYLFHLLREHVNTFRPLSTL